MEFFRIFSFHLHMSNNRSKQREIVFNLLGDSLYKLPKEDRGDPKILESARVCKSYLIWQCPFKMLEGTRDVPICNKSHSDRYRMIYQGMEPRADFEQEHLDQLKRCLTSCDSKIAIANARFETADNEDDADANGADIKMGIISQEIDSLVSHGDVIRALDECREIESNDNAHAKNARVDDIPTQACTVCGAVLSRLDNDRRLADHFVGRVHLAYAQIRDRVEYIESKDSSSIK